MFHLAEMTGEQWHACRDALAELAKGAQSLEEVAHRTVTYLYEQLGSVGNGKSVRACALVRMYKTHTYRNLPASLMDFVDATLGEPPAYSGMKCLTLMATVGDEPAWNHRSQSRGHQAIPLASEEMVTRIPMVAQLVNQFGLDVKAVLTPPDPDLILDLAQKKYHVFYVPQAEGSPYVPAQENFVIPYGIRSVVGFGGMLPSGDLYAVILFSRVPLSRTVAEEFEGLALPVKIALLPFIFQNVFAPGIS